MAPIALAVHPDDPDVVWVGTVAGAYRTVDGGDSWHLMADLPSMPIYALAVSPDGSTQYAGGEAASVWRSRDGGQTWSSVELADLVGGVLSLAVGYDGTIYAGTAGSGTWVSRDRASTVGRSAATGRSREPPSQVIRGGTPKRGAA